MKTLFETMMMAVLVLAATSPPATAQAPKKDAIYKTALTPVWVAVHDMPDKPGLPRVGVAVEWDPAEHGLRFSGDVGLSELTVVIPSAGAGKRGGSQTCLYENEAIGHGAEGYEAMASSDEKCRTLPAKHLSGITVHHLNDPMACEDAGYFTLSNGGSVRFFGCSWAEKPKSGGP